MKIEKDSVLYHLYVANIKAKLYKLYKWWLLGSGAGGDEAVARQSIQTSTI